MRLTNACSFRGQCLLEVYVPLLNRPTDNLRRGAARERLLETVARKVDRLLAKTEKVVEASIKVEDFTNYFDYERACLVKAGCYYGNSLTRDREIAKAAAAWRAHGK